MSTTTHQPLAVEMLLTTDQRRLREATDTNLPLPASMAEDCADCIRKIYQAAPLDMPSVNRRKDAEVSRVLGILDELELRKENH